jgi:hypothetical protein
MKTLKRKLPVKRLTESQWRKLQRLGRHQVLLHEQLVRVNDAIVKLVDGERYRRRIDRCYSRLYIEWAKLKRENILLKQRHER